MKRIVETRWSAKHDAVKVIKSHYEKVLEALERLTGPIENADTRGDASVVLASITKFQFISYLNMWGEILPEIDKTQKYLQNKVLGFDQSVVAV